MSAPVVSQAPAVNGTAGGGSVMSAVIPTHRSAGFLSVGGTPEAVAS